MKFNLTNLPSLLLSLIRVLFDFRDHSHISQQHSYEEYFDSSNFAYQTSYVGDDSRQWDSRGQYFFDDGFGLTPTEYENIINKRRSSVVQLPQIPPKQVCLHSPVKMAVVPFRLQFYVFCPCNYAGSLQ